MGRQQGFIERPAISIKQNEKCPLFVFSLTGDELFQIADISRVSRDEAGRLIGYQRPEVKRHIKNIVEYLDSEEVLFPNSLILSLSRDVKFVPLGKTQQNNASTLGYVRIPLGRNGKRRPGWIVDGQQRALALAKANRRDFPVPISAFIADDVNLQRDQFLRVNSTKPLPRGLITELLPNVAGVLPANLSARKLPSALCDVLNETSDSPFYRLIRRSSMSESQRKKGVVADTAVVQMLQDSLMSPSGCLFAYRNIATGETDVKGIQTLLFVFWGAVKDVFPNAWGLAPTQSRLMHSAGIRAMGKLMDKVMNSFDHRDPRAAIKVRQDVARLRSLCHWTSGEWEELGGLAWNEIQNIPGHIRMLSNLLVRSYLNMQSSRR